MGSGGWTRPTRTRPRRIYGYRPEVDDRPIPLVTEADAATPALSPDGQWIAYALAEAGHREVYVSPFPNVSDWKRQISNDGGGQPLWSPDGTEPFFTDQDRSLNVASIETESGFRHTVPRVLFEFDVSYELRDYQRVLDITSDGQRFLAGRTVGGGDRLVWVQNFREELERLVPN